MPLFLLWEWNINSLSHRSLWLSILVLSKEKEIKFMYAQQEVELEKKRTKAMLSCRNSSIIYYRKTDMASLTEMLQVVKQYFLCTDVKHQPNNQTFLKQNQRTQNINFEVHQHYRQKNISSVALRDTLFSFKSNCLGSSHRIAVQIQKLSPHILFAGGWGCMNYSC